uniref:RNA-directed DNA polymerase n=1 Tax=Monodelphis domestica TaxID=13616 RepID=K7E102_MONDO
MPSNKLLQFFTLTPFTLTRITQSSPIPGAPTIFVDGSKTGLAAIVMHDCPHTIHTPYQSAQLVELYAALTVFISLPESPFNLYSDSRYVVQSLLRLEATPVIQPTTATFFLFTKIQQAIRARSHPFFIGHIRAHSGLPGPLALGNDLADQYTRLAALAVPTIPSPDPISLATEAHKLHHLNAHTLRLAYKITREQARAIVKSCKNCLTLLPEPHFGVNPRGLLPGHLWQMDVTHVPSFAKLKYVHVSIDTFSGFLFASAQSGEATKHVIKHMFLAMSVMGRPLTLKTDNGPGYTSRSFKQFCAQLGIKHITGIPYNPQ